jgi:hypothetical protein
MNMATSRTCMKSEPLSVSEKLSIIKDMVFQKPITPKSPKN